MSNTKTIKPASSSRRRVSQVVETVRGETPANATYKVLDFLQNTQLDQTQTFERSAVVKSNRMGGKQIGGNVSAGGTLAIPMKYDASVRELLESAFSGTFTQLSASGAGGNTQGFSLDSVGSQASGTITVTTVVPSNGDTLTINGVAFTFKTVPVSNRDIEIGADLNGTATNIAAKLEASTDPRVNIANYTASTAAVTVSYINTGVEGNSFTLATSNAVNLVLSGATLTGGTVGSDCIKRTTGNFVTEGWQAGDKVKLENATSAANDFGYADDVFVETVEDTKLTLSANARIATDEVFAATTLLTNASYYLKAGVDRKFFTHEVAYTDMEPVLYEYLRGGEVNTFNVTVPTSGEVKAEAQMIHLIGKLTEVPFDRSNNLSGTTVIGTGTYVEPLPTVSFAGSVEGAKLTRGGSSAPDVESMTLNVNNNRAAKFSVGQASASFVEEGDFDLEAQFSLYFADKTVQEQYQKGTRTSLMIAMKDQQDGHRMVIELPNIVFTQAPKQANGNTMTQNMTAFAEEDPVHKTKARVWVQPNPKS